MSISKEQLGAGLRVVFEVTQAVKDAGVLGIPEGALYTALMSKGVTLSGFESLKNCVLKTGLIESRNHCLYWVGGVV